MSDKNLTDPCILSRKNEHIEICLNQDVESSDKFTGFSDYYFEPKALPEINPEDVSLGCSFLGNKFDLPILIPSMVGGTKEAHEINLRIAEVAQKLNIPMGVGSQKIALENKDCVQYFKIKDRFPNVFLIGNVGISVLQTDNYVDKCKQAVDMIEADALSIHVNVLQELIQKEGLRKFAGLHKKMEKVVAGLKVPIIVKEVGFGLDASTSATLRNVGVKALDTGGRGGTSWAFIEGLRAKEDSSRLLGTTFRDWGIPTATSLKELAKTCPELDIVATGGIRSGIDVAKAVALGASLVGIGLPLFRAASINVQELEALTLKLKNELLLTLICTGSKTLEDLKFCFKRIGK